MLSKWLCPILFLTLMFTASIAHSQQPAPGTFTVHDGQFLLNGKPFRIISGEMHYARIPRAYWGDRFRMAKAMGLNAVTTYVFWNVHEPRPGVYDFSGNHDVAEFIREAQQEGLYVILRPGPYACAEWDFGGFPAWLLKDHSTVVRSRDPKYLEPAGRWIKRLGQELAPLQIGNGGPILLVQVENEYGSFGDDHAYMRDIQRMLVDAGFTKSVLYTADGADEIPAGSLPDLPVGINFGGGDEGAAQKEFAKLKKFRPNGPFLNSEFWDGWFDHWGGKHGVTNAGNEAANLDWMLRHGYSVSLYMFHGGTSFGWMNGANSDGKNYEPDVTSYDYDAPLDESGRPKPKYFTFRDVIAKATGITPPPVPTVPPTMKIPEFKLEESVSLWKVLPNPVHSEQILSMEDLDQAYGYILYRKQLDGPIEGDLVLDELHDYAQIYLDYKLVGTLDRRLGQNRLPVEVSANGAQLDILVENSGRINFNIVLRQERKGITKQITLAGKPLLDWDIFSLPMTDTLSLPFTRTPCIGPCFHRGAFRVDERADTFLDTSAFTKGALWPGWLDGQPLGRIWSIGPQQTLYVPGPFLLSHPGFQSVVVFELNSADVPYTLMGRDQPILDLVVAH
ncbi:MAG TPA: beta-galactosidase family protein [Candidatus Acidoferrum sp.]|nr:beta-galactosidase family protein [Candidatus Acidoferrum sp.]